MVWISWVGDTSFGGGKTFQVALMNTMARVNVTLLAVVLGKHHPPSPKNLFKDTLGAGEMAQWFRIPTAGVWSPAPVPDGQQTPVTPDPREQAPISDACEHHTHISKINLFKEDYFGPHRST